MIGDVKIMFGQHCCNFTGYSARRSLRTIIMLRVSVMNVVDSTSEWR